MGMINDYKRKVKRVELVGSDGVNMQDERRRKIDKLPKQVTKDVQKRMKEYKQGYVAKETTINKVKRYK
jgi:predicted methyltransferase